MLPNLRKIYNLMMLFRGVSQVISESRTCHAVFQPKSRLRVSLPEDAIGAE